MKNKTIKFIMLSILLLSFSQNSFAKKTANNENSDLDFIPAFEAETSIKNKIGSPKIAEKKQVISKTEIESKEVNNKQSSYQFTFDNILQVSNKKNQSDLIFSTNGQDNTNWSNLSRIGMRSDIALRPDLSFKTSLLLNAYTREGDNFSSSKDLRLDIKEAYLSWQQSPTQYIDLGRINIKNGVAQGFNPTDYFKIGTLLDRNTEDVSQLRDARIGSLVLRGQKLWDSGSLTMVLSPKISNKNDHWTTSKNIYGLNLHKSNDRSRIMLKLSQNIAEDIGPELIYYNESGKHNLGLNLSKSFNDQLIGYAEWNIGERRNLVDEAFQKPRNNSRLHPQIRQAFTTDKGESYQQQFAVGFSYTAKSNITTNLEYHYNQAGLSKSQANKWFNTAEASNNSVVLGQLQSIRGLAQIRNEPLGQHSLFLRSKWSNAFIDKLDLSGLLVGDLNDNSQILQLEAEYELNSKSTLSLNLAKYQGKRKSIYGSLENDLTASVQFEYNF